MQIELNINQTDEFNSSQRAFVFEYSTRDVGFTGTLTNLETIE